MLSRILFVFTLISFYGCSSDTSKSDFVTNNPNTIGTVEINSDFHNKTFSYNKALPPYINENYSIEAFIKTSADHSENSLTITLYRNHKTTPFNNFNNVILDLNVALDELGQPLLENTTAQYQPKEKLIYQHHDKDPNTSISLFLEPLLGKNSRIKGTFEAELCLTDAIFTGNCEVSKNRVTLTGKINVIQDHSQNTSEQGSIEQPIDLEAPPFNLTNLYSIPSGSFYQIPVKKNKKYKIYSLGSLQVSSIKAYNNEQRDAPDCSIEENLDNPEESINFCFITTRDNEKIYIDVTNSSSATLPFGLSMEEADSLTSEGSGSAPLSKGIVKFSLNFNGQVNSTKPSYYSIQVFPQKTFTLTLSNTTGINPLYMSIYDNGELLCSAYHQCIIKPSQSVLVITVTTPLEHYSTKFDISINETGNLLSYIGTKESPKSITENVISGSTGTLQRSSFYAIQVIEEETYQFNFDTLDSNTLLMSIYDNEQDNNIICKFSQLCRVKSKDGDSQLLLQVISTNPSGEIFQLSYNRLPLIESEGSLDLPYSITNEINLSDKYSGMVSNNSESFYAFTGEPGSSYTFAFDNIEHSSAQFEILENEKLLCRGGFKTNSLKACTAESDSGNFIIKVSLNDTIDLENGTFDIDIKEEGTSYIAEGTNLSPKFIDDEAPILIQSAETNIDGSYYMFKVISGNTYKVELNNITGDNVELAAFASSEECRSSNIAQLNESCDIQIPEDTDLLIIAITGIYLTTGANYNIKISEITQ